MKIIRIFLAGFSLGMGMVAMQLPDENPWLIGGFFGCALFFSLISIDNIVRSTK